MKYIFNKHSETQGEYMTGVAFCECSICANLSGKGLLLEIANFMIIEQADIFKTNAAFNEHDKTRLFDHWLAEKDITRLEFEEMLLGEYGDDFMECDDELADRIRVEFGIDCLDSHQMLIDELEMVKLEVIALKSYTAYQPSSFKKQNRNIIIAATEVLDNNVRIEEISW